MKIVTKINQILQEYSTGNKINAYKKLKKIFSKYQSNKKNKTFFICINKLIFKKINYIVKFSIYHEISYFLPN